MPSFFPYWVVITHFLNLFFMVLLFRSGLEVLSAFPKLYCNDDCPPGGNGRGSPRRCTAPTPAGYGALPGSA